MRRPEAIDQVTTVMGHLQDDLKAGEQGLARKDSDKLRDLMGKQGLSKISDELDEFRPAGHKSFRKWIKKQTQEIRKTLGDESAPKMVTPKTFHGMRKVITQILAVVDVVNATDASAESLELGKYLSSLNAEMGNVHDDLVLKGLQGKIDYDHEKLAVPADIRDLLKQFIDSVN